MFSANATRKPVPARANPRIGWTGVCRTAAALLLLTGMADRASATEVSRAATGLVYHEDYLLHDNGWGHPETPARLEAIVALLESEGLPGRLQRVAPRAAAEEWLLTVHTSSYLDQLKDASRAAPVQLDPDTSLSAASLRVAHLATGGVLAAVDAVMAGQVKNAFAAVRPPGHHARPAQAMGFCLFNNVAVAARYLQRHHGLERILIVDWDVHHGNGTQEIFYDDPSVLYFSTHQYPYYPGTGAASEQGVGEGLGSTINVPLPAGVGDAEVIAAFKQKLLPAVADFRPQFVLVSAGFDGHRDDPLAQLRMSEDGFRELTRMVMGIADRYAHGRLVSMLEGGYDLEALARSVRAHVEALQQH